jgi:hypothetical protein
MPVPSVTRKSQSRGKGGAAHYSMGLLARAANLPPDCSGLVIRGRCKGYLARKEAALSSQGALPIHWCSLLAAGQDPLYSCNPFVHVLLLIQNYVPKARRRYIGAACWPQVITFFLYLSLRQAFHPQAMQRQPFLAYDPFIATSIPWGSPCPFFRYVSILCDMIDSLGQPQCVVAVCCCMHL